MLARLDVGDDDAGDRKAVAFGRFLLFESAAHGWIAYLHGAEEAFGPTLLAVAIVLTITAVSGLANRTLRPALCVAAAVMFVRLIATFPHLYNHLFLEAVLTTAAASTRLREREEANVLLQFARGVVCLVLFWSGLQKALHGCYFGGEFLAVSIATNEYFAAPFALFAPDEVLRLRGLLPLAVGAGPFRLESAHLLFASNLVWILEIALPVALLVPATRRLGLFGALLFLVAIEAAARELIFGLLFGGTLLLFARGRVFERAMPLLILGLAAVCAIAWLRPDVWIN